MSAYIASSVGEAKQLYEHDVQSSPSEVTWKDDCTGLECRVVKNSALGTYCGYVTLREPLQTSDILPLVDAVKQSVHGGITYCDGDEIGFDCAHVGDYSPNGQKGLRVWTFEAVKNETAKLAAAVKRYFQL